MPSEKRFREVVRFAVYVFSAILFIGAGVFGKVEMPFRIFAILYGLTHVLRAYLTLPLPPRDQKP